MCMYGKLVPKLNFTLCDTNPHTEYEKDKYDSMYNLSALCLTKDLCFPTLSLVRSCTMGHHFSSFNNVIA